MTTPRFLTAQQFADWFQMPEPTVRMRIRQHFGNPADPSTIRAINLGSTRRPQWRIPMSEVRRFEGRTAA